MPVLIGLDRVSLMLSQLGKAGFPGQLLKIIRGEVVCDSIVLLLYRKGDSPTIIHDEMSARDRLALKKAYFDGAYLLSPFYLSWLGGIQTGLLRLRDITPEGFFDSVYYTDYYARSGLIDELAYIVPLQDNSAILLSLGRIEESDDFSVDERRLLQAFEPLVREGFQRHFSLYSLPPRHAMKDWLEDGLRLFGRSVLTEREQEVVQMMLRGYSSKSCARVLGISPTTERVHRRKIYSKLDITSQAELFSLFFTAMSHDNLAAGDDPFQLL